ncbi:MAG TPA: hypothetical protein VIG47_12990 [Gemmatimonadaceae bacterium]
MIFASACASEHRAPQAGAIRDSLNAVAGARADVAITQLAPGDWTELFVFGPYSSPEVVARCVGSRVDDAGIASRDDIDLLIFRFADGSTVTRAVPRGSTTFQAGAYSRDATFRVVRNPPGPSTFLIPMAGLTKHCSTRAIQ